MHDLTGLKYHQITSMTKQKPDMLQDEQALTKTLLVAFSLGTGYFKLSSVIEEVVFNGSIRKSFEYGDVCGNDSSCNMKNTTSIGTEKISRQPIHSPIASSVRNVFGNMQNESAIEWSDKSISLTVEIWGLSSEDHQKLIELGNRLQDIDYHFKNNPSNVVRFLVASSGDVTSAEKMFRNMVSWRRQHNVDQILLSYHPPKDILNFYPGAVLRGLDYDGDPIFVSRLGVTDAAGMLQRFGRDEMIQHAIWLRELLCTGQWMQEYEKKHNRPVKRAVVIEDLHGIQLRQIIFNRPLLSLYSEIMRLDQDNYPEAAKKIFILRAPTLFHMIWNVVQHFFDANVREKMIFTTRTNYLEILSQHLDMSVLPRCIVPEFGKGSALDGMPPNFEGGRLPAVPVNKR